jgi:hypothetical protein
MEQRLPRQITMIVLRLAGVSTIFIELVFMTQTASQWMAAHSALSDMPYGGLPPGVKINVTAAGGWTLAGQAVIIVWGLLLIALARPMATAIVRDSPPQQTAAADLTRG